MRIRDIDTERFSGPVARREIGAIAGLLLLMVVLAWPGLTGNSVTIDEFAHMPAGYLTLREGALGVYPKTPPLVRSLEALPWLAAQPALSPGILEQLDPYDPWHPWILGDDVMQLNREIYDRLFIQSRLVTLSLALVGGLLIWGWSRQLSGPQGGLLSLALFVTSPTILAHASVATVDVGSAVLFSATLFALWRFLERPSASRALVCGLLLGAALLAKMTALILLPLVVVITLAALVIPPRPDRARVRSLLGGLVVVLVTAVLLLNLAYGLRGSFAGWGSRDLFSRTLSKATGWLPGWMPSGLPSWYVFGLDTQLLDLEQGEFPGYLLGEWSQEGRWQYFPVAFASKEPLPFLLLLAASLGALGGRRQRRDLLTELCLILPILTVVAVAMRGGRLQIGIRYLLPIYPLIFVHLGRLALIPQSFMKVRARRVAALIIAGLVGLQAVAVSLAGPDYLSYFSLAAGGSQNGHQILLDSNLDWGQDLKRAATWSHENKEERPFLAYFGHVDPHLYDLDYALPPRQPTRGTYLVSANYLYGLSYPASWARSPAGEIDVGWLQNHQPIDRIGNSIFVFRVD
jgi:hypothetical protein